MGALLFVAATVFGEPEAEANAAADPSADPSADPYYLTYGYGLGHYGYAGYYGYPYAHYGYWGRKRRSAEAEAEATPSADPEADPYYLYRGYYGHYGYPYRHYGYGYWGRKRRSAEPKQKPPLTPRLILTCCMEDIMDTDTDTDTMDILMVDTTGENKPPQQPNIKETPKYIVKSSA